MEDGPQNIKCNIAKTKYIQKKSLLSEINAYDTKQTTYVSVIFFNMTKLKRYK